MRHSIIALAAFAAVAFAPASVTPASETVVRSPGGIEYLVPAASPVTKFAVEKDGEAGETYETGAVFEGKFILSGVFHADGGEDGFVFLKPDAAIAARLPRWKEGSAPVEIWFENREAVLRALAPGGRAVNRHVTLDVDRYAVHIECDTANYAVRFLSVHAPAVVAANVSPQEGC